MNAAEYIILALLALGVSVLAGAVRGVQTRLDTLEGASVDDKKSIEDSRAIIDKHAGDFVRIQHRIAALEGPRHLIGRFGTHEGKDGQPRRVEIVSVKPGGDGNPPRYTVRYQGGNRPPIEYTIAADQVELEH